jgi:putative restriction endonuclease
MGDPHSELRAAMFAWLNARAEAGLTTVTRAELEAFTFQGKRVPLILRVPGIRLIPGGRAPLSIMTSYRPPGATRPYDDAIGSDGFARYKWCGTDPQRADNRALRAAIEDRTDLAWFVGVASSLYSPVYPVRLVAEEPESHQVVAAVDPAQFDAFTVGPSPIERSWLSRTTKRRLHQPIFAEQVMRAYEEHCAVCKLGHRILLDAAHIIPDSRENGDAVVTNGMALCKIHHAAYDQNFIGIDPDYRVHVRLDLLEERDGPMLQHGIKDLDKKPLMWLPRQKSVWPDPVRLNERFHEFKAAV